MFSSRTEWLVLFILMIIGGIGVAVPRFDGAGDDKTEMASGETEQAPEQTTEQAPAAIEPPSVDTMRFDGTQGVVSGMAAPNSDIVIRENGNELARGKTDGNGNFALTFDYETPEDGAILQLSQIDTDGVETAALEALSVMPIADGDTQTATLTEDGVEIEAPKAKQLALGQMSYGSAATPWMLQGTGEPGADIDIFVDGNKVGTTKADEAGVWNYQGTGVEPGTYELGLSENGSEPITQNITLKADDFAPETETASNANNGNGQAGQSVQLGDKLYTVQRGDSLWRIAERFYGKGQGYRYTEIFDVNSNQIKNPDLIYPEQEFDVPKSN